MTLLHGSQCKAFIAAAALCSPRKTMLSDRLQSPNYNVKLNRIRCAPPTTIMITTPAIKCTKRRRKLRFPAQESSLYNMVHISQKTFRRIRQEHKRSTAITKLHRLPGQKSNILTAKLRQQHANFKSQLTLHHALNHIKEGYLKDIPGKRTV